MRRSRLAATMVLLTFVLIWIIPLQAQAAANPIAVMIDGSPVAFDAQPVLIDGTTLVQVRPIMEKLGLDIRWDGQTQTVIGSFKGRVVVKLSIGSSTAQAGDSTTQLEVAPRLIDGYTFVPIRLVGEATGRVVSWNGPQRAVGIHTPMSVYIRELLLDTDKLSYEGDTIANGVWDGQGKLFANGVKLYDGEVKDGRLSGYGFLYRVEDGSLLYAGNFADNAPDGEGVRYLPDGSKYTGDFAEGKQSGSGSLLDAEGSLLFQGKWKDDLKNGEGVAYRKGKVIEKGVYSGGALWEGRTVRMTFLNGDSAVEIYEAGSAAKREITDLSGRVVYSSMDGPSPYDRELRYASEAQGLTVYVPEYWRGKFEVTEKGRQIEIFSKGSSGSGANMLAAIYVYTEAELQELGGAGEIPYHPLGSANGRHYFYTTAEKESSGSGSEAGSGARAELGVGDAELFDRLLFGVPYVIGHIQLTES